ncbi:MAG: GTPase Era [Bacilli bacterium]
MKSGFVTVIGRPNVGKSTLINTIVGEKIAITSSKPQTTRNLIQGIYNEEDTQIVFVDTPGIHKPIHRLGLKLNDQAYSSINDVDLILFIVDASVSIGTGDKFIIDKLSSIDKPVILILNKIDRIKNEDILTKIDEYKDLYDFSEIIPVSAIKNDNVDRLITTLKKYLPDSVKYFPDNDTKTSSSTDFRICETVREKLLELTNEEVPHSVACLITNITQKPNILEIYIDIIVDRDSLKKIIIGKKGSKLKEIGTLARIDLEQMLNKQVYLELNVRTIKKWRDKEKYLTELGFDDYKN